MPAYFRSSIDDFLDMEDDLIIGQLHAAYANDGFVSQYTAQTTAWGRTLPALRRELSELLVQQQQARTWQLIFEFPLYRLRRRIDALILTPEAVVVLELKTGATTFDSMDRRQTEEYAQDLRDFHFGSRSSRLRPMLWALEADPVPLTASEPANSAGVSRLELVGRSGLARALLIAGGSSAFSTKGHAQEFGKAWDESPYRPIPSVIEAATSLFAGHGVREITLSSAKNLGAASSTVLAIINEARSHGDHCLVFLTGVPGAGKTLAGLNVVHSAVTTGVEADRDIVYLSGNTPLVVVLRESLARDQNRRSVLAGERVTLADARTTMRATVQHINDFLKEYVQGSDSPPAEHVVVFDEAQRAWDARQGKEKFGREASEPLLVLETMARHKDWAVCVCLIGTGQEINDGEEGVVGWADAIAVLSKSTTRRWKVYGSAELLSAERGTGSLGPLPTAVRCMVDSSLHLDVPMRSFRSPELGTWIEHVINGDSSSALQVVAQVAYPIKVTRSLVAAKAWLRAKALGERRIGLLASSGAKRLRADGLGQMLSAMDGQAIAHWYLNPPGDIRSSFALEVPANEYTSQGLEIDFGCLCWGGDLVYVDHDWMTRSLSGNKWNVVSDSVRRRFILNSYRVLLSRAREGMVIWIPTGECTDHTRQPGEFEAVADMLLASGARLLDAAWP